MHLKKETIAESDMRELLKRYGDNSSPSNEEKELMKYFYTEEYRKDKLHKERIKALHHIFIVVLIIIGTIIACSIMHSLVTSIDKSRKKDIDTIITNAVPIITLEELRNNEYYTIDYNENRSKYANNYFIYKTIGEVKRIKFTENSKIILKHYNCNTPMMYLSSYNGDQIIVIFSKDVMEDSKQK